MTPNKNLVQPLDLSFPLQYEGGKHFGREALGRSVGPQGGTVLLHRSSHVPFPDKTVHTNSFDEIGQFFVYAHRSGVLISQLVLTKVHIFPSRCFCAFDGFLFAFIE